MRSSDADNSGRTLALLAVVLAAVMFVFPLAIGFPLLDPDEGLHASIAQDMVERGDWTTPRFLGRPFLDKPIFYFWVQAASLWLFGPSETAVRLPGLMFGLLGAISTGLLGWRMFNRATGLIAGILYATTILPTALAQAASHDVALIPWINLTLLLLWEAAAFSGEAPAVGGDCSRRSVAAQARRRLESPPTFVPVRGRSVSGVGDPHQGVVRRGRGGIGLRRLPADNAAL